MKVKVKKNNLEIEGRFVMSDNGIFMFETPEDLAFSMDEITPTITDITGIFNINHPICPICGSEIIWSNDWMGSDYSGEDVPLDDDYIIHNFSCPHCGGNIDVSEPCENERLNYDFWKRDEDNDKKEYK